jgi:acylphosphatase
MVIASGEVQGVGFRNAVQKEARNLAIAGYARNKMDGSVEILAQGEASKLELFLNTIRAFGPPIFVETLERRPATVSKRRKHFEVLHGNTEEVLDDGLGASEDETC